MCTPTNIAATDSPALDTPILDSDTPQEWTTAVALSQAGERMAAKPTAGMTDAIVLTSDYYIVVDENNNPVVDAAKIGKMGLLHESGKLRVSILASLADKPNANNRYFTAAYFRKVAPIVDRQCKATPTYGEEPHPPYNENTGQYETNSSKEVWQCVGWHVNKAGDLWATIVCDERTPQGKRAAQKIRDGEKLGVSVRWTPIGNAHQSATLSDGRRVDYYDVEAADKGFYPIVPDHVPNPAFTGVGYTMADCEHTGCNLPMTDAAGISHTGVVTVTVDKPPFPVLIAAAQAAAAIGKTPAPKTDSTTTDSTKKCDCPSLVAKPASDSAHQRPCTCNSHTEAPPSQVSLADSSEIATTSNLTQSEEGAGIPPTASHHPDSTTVVDDAFAAATSGQTTGSMAAGQKATPPMTIDEARAMSLKDRKAALKRLRGSFAGITDSALLAAAQADADTLTDSLVDDDGGDMDAKAKADAKSEAEAKAKTDAEELKTKMADEKLNTERLDAAQVALDAKIVEMDAKIAKMDAHQATMDAQAAQAVVDAAKGEVKSLVTGLRAGEVDGYDLTRFNERQRNLFADAVASKAGIADAKELLDAQIAIADNFAAIADASGMGYKQEQAKPVGATVDDTRGKDGKVAVTVDAGDKMVAEFKKSMHDSWDKFGYDKEGFIPDPELRRANSAFIGEQRERVQSKVAAKGHDWDKAVHDSVLYMKSTPAEREKIDLKPSRAAMVDAGIMTKAVADAAGTTGTGQLLNQASLADFYMERVYFDSDALPYVGGLGDGQFVQGSPGATSPIGTTLRIPTIYRDNSSIDYPNDFGSLVVAESAAIPPMNPDIAYAEYPVFPRRQSVRLTADIEAQLAHGPLGQNGMGLNALALAMYQFTQAFTLSTDRYLYMEMDASTSEMSAVFLSGLAESPATGDIVNGNIQDNITYGATVACVVQPLCNGAVSGAVQVSSFTPSAAASYRFPILRPRKSTIVNADGSRTATVLNDVIVKKSGTTLIRGYMDDNGDIQSYAGTTAAYAVDFKTGKFLFTAASGVTASAKPTLVQYAYSTNVDFIQVNFAANAYPNSLKQADYMNALVYQFDKTESKLSSYPNYIRPNTVLSTYNGSVNLRNASIFYAFLSPNGTNLEGSGIMRSQYAKRANLSFSHTNTPAAFGDDTHLVLAKGFTKYAIDTPWTVSGPVRAYDLATGLPTDDQYWTAHEFSVISTPLPKDQSGAILNKSARRIVTY